MSMYLPRINDDTRQVERYIKEDGLVKGARKFFSLKTLAWAVPTAVMIGTIGWKCYCEMKSKIAIQDKASSNRMSEQDNATKNKKDEILAQSEADALRIKTNSRATLDAIELREKLRRERNQKDSLSGCEEAAESYAEAKANGHLTGLGVRYLGHSYFKAGYSRAFIGPADIGKTTYLRHEATAIARGECGIPLTEKWYPIPPIHVVYFSLEQTYEEVEEFWGKEIDSIKSHLHLYCGQISPAEILDIVKDYLKNSGEYGVVVYIDNEGKLEQYAPSKEIVKMNHELEQMRQTAFRSNRPLTVVKVYHTASKYDMTKPFAINSVRGDKNSVNLNNDVMFITKTSLGEDKRMVGFLKNKHGQKNHVNIVEFAGTEVDQFRYVGQAREADVLCTKNPEETPSANVVFDPHKPGRKPTITYEEAIELQNMVTSGERTWRQIEEETGHSKSKVKECIRSHKPKDEGGTEM